MHTGDAVSLVRRHVDGPDPLHQHPVSDSTSRWRTTSSRIVARLGHAEHACHPAIGNTAWCALMNRKTRTLSCRSPVRTRPPLLPGSRAPDAAGGSHGADGPTQPAPPPEAHHRGGQHHIRLGAPNSRSLAPLARTRVTALPAFGLTAPARPSVAEIPARMAGDSSASQHLLLKWKGVHETGSTPTSHRSLSPVAGQITGLAWEGPLF